MRILESVFGLDSVCHIGNVGSISVLLLMLACVCVVKPCWRLLICSAHLHPLPLQPDSYSGAVAGQTNGIDLSNRRVVAGSSNQLAHGLALGTGTNPGCECEISCKSRDY